MIKNIKKEITSGLMNSSISKLINGDSNDLLVKEDDIIYQLTTSKNQNNNENKNISSIFLGECEDKLKSEYDIDKNQTLLIFKIDYFKPDSLIPIIGYEIYHPVTKEKLNLKYCEKIFMNYSIPVIIDEENLFKYDPNNEYYKSECIPYTTEVGTDLIINDRQDEYNNNNLSICENNCTFKNYDTDNKKSICECEIQSKDLKISEIANKSDILNYNFIKKTHSSNFVSMKCYYTLFTKDGIYKNICSYILLFIILFFIISGILFYKCGYYSLENIIKEIISNRRNKEKNIHIVETVGKNKKKKKVKNKNKSVPPIKKIKKNKKNLDLRNKNGEIKLKIKKVINNKIINQNKNNNSSYRSYSKLKLKIKDNFILSNNKNENNTQNKNLLNLNDFELNNCSYKFALKYDKRSICIYYISLIKTKHPLLFPFLSFNDYNSFIIKINIFFISFSIYLFINAFFFDENVMHKIYIDKGIYNFKYLIQYILYSFIISYFLSTLIKYFSLSERNIYEIKIENINNIYDKENKVKRCLCIKYIIFFILGILFLLFLWYYLSSFGAIYQNTQIYLIKNTLISFGFSLIYPFIINVFPAILRIYSLTNNNKKCLYKIVIFIQLI